MASTGASKRLSPTLALAIAAAIGLGISAIALHALAHDAPDPATPTPTPSRTRPSAVAVAPPASTTPARPASREERAAQAVQAAEASARRLLELPPEALRSPAAEYAALRTGLAESGPAVEDWASRARDVLATLSGVVEPGQARTSAIACYAAGCIVDLVFGEPAGGPAAMHAVTEPVLTQLARWPGTHMLTGPRRGPDGWTQAAILIRPL